MGGTCLRTLYLYSNIRQFDQLLKACHCKVLAMGKAAAGA